METNLKTYLFSIEIEPLIVGQAYDTLPLHCTLMHRFLTDLSFEILIEKTQQVFVDSPAIPIIPGKQVPFGPRSQLVNLLKPSRELLALHRGLYNSLSALNVHYSEAEWVGSGYTAHVSDVAGRTLTSRPRVAHAAYLIEVEFPLIGNQKFVRYKFPLHQPS